MQLLASGRDSLNTFKPSDFKLFALVTLKSLLESYKIWLKYWGWLIIIAVPVCFLLGRASLLYIFFPGWTAALSLTNLPMSSLMILGALSYACIIISLVLSTRPSAGLKNCHYIKQFKMHFLYAIVWLLGIVPSLLYIILVPVALTAFAPRDLVISSWLITLIGSLLAIFVLPIITVLFMLFLFDSDGTIVQVFKAVWRAFKMALYNLPLYICMVLLFGLVVVISTVVVMALLWGFSMVVSAHLLIYISTVMILLLLLFLLPLAINIITNLYVKRLHEQYNLYYQ